MSRYRLILTEKYYPWWGLGRLEKKITTILTSPPEITYEEAKEARLQLLSVVKRDVVNIRLEEVEA